MSEAEPALEPLAQGRRFPLSPRPWTAVWTGLLAERERWPLWLPVLIGAGIALYFALPSEPSLGTAIAGLALATTLAALSRGRAGAPLAIAVLACALGFAAAKWRSDRVAAPILSHRIGPLPVEGRVVAVTDRAGGGATLILDRLHLVRRYPMRVPERIKLTMRARKPAPAVGERVRLLGVLMPPPPPAAPGSYDFARAAWFARIGAVGYVLGAPTVIAAPPETAFRSLSVALTKLRHDLSLHIRADLGAPAGPIAAALLTGDQSGVEPATNLALRNAGLAHLLSISGLHMAMVAGILFFVVRAALSLIRPLALRRPIKKWAAIAGLIGTFCYLLLSGSSYPSLRSFLMTAAGLLALMVDRSPISMRILAVAAIVLLLTTPEALLNVSFQLSFAAVAALIALYEAWGSRLTPNRDLGIFARGWLWIGASLASGLACELALAPIAAYQFNRLAIFGAVANLVAIPLFGFWIMPAGILALVLVPFGMAGPILAVMGWGIDVLLALAHWVAAWPSAVIPVPAIPAAGFVLMIVGEAWFLLWQRSWRWLGLGLIVAGIGLAVAAPAPDVLIDRDGKLVAVRNAEGRLVFSSLRRGRFARDLWLRRDGRSIESGAAGGAPKAKCDGDNCRFDAAGGRSVAYLAAPPAPGQNCPAADLVVTPSVLGACPGAQHVVDGRALARGGAHAVWFTAEGLRTETVRDGRGIRPWSRPPSRFRSKDFRNSGETRRSSGPAP